VLYNECDGAELEASSMVLDLRFIPEDMTFERKLRDEARAVPPKYKLPAFAASALQNSTVTASSHPANPDSNPNPNPDPNQVTSSWDQDDAQRKQAMQKNFKKSEMREVDYSAYLASDSEEDEDGVEEYPFLDAPLAPPREGAARLHAAARAGGDAEDEGGEGEHELTFMPALEGKAARRAQGEAPPSCFEVEQRKRKERRLAARKGGSAAAASASAASAEAEAEEGEEEAMPSDVEDDPFFAEAMRERDEEERGARRQQERERGGAGARDVGGGGAGSSSAADAARGKKGRKGKKGRPVLSAEEREAEAKRAAELELLVMDADDGGRHYNAKRLELPSGRRDLKGKRRAREAAKAAEAEAADDGFQLDTNDARFQQLFRSHDYAIDPTHPKFKRTLASEQLMAEVSRRHVQAPPPAAEPQRPAGASSDTALKALVSSLKSKASAKAKAKPAAAAQRPPKRPLSS